MDRRWPPGRQFAALLRAVCLPSHRLLRPPQVSCALSASFGTSISWTGGGGAPCLRLCRLECLQGARTFLQAQLFASNVILKSFSSPLHALGISVCLAKQSFLRFKNVLFLFPFPLHPLNTCCPFLFPFFLWRKPVPLYPAPLLRCWWAVMQLCLPASSLPFALC